jgi:hypothetical protein
MITLLLIVLSVIVFCGILRVIFRPSDTFGDLLLDMFFLDVLGDLLTGLIEAIGDSDWS